MNKRPKFITGIGSVAPRLASGNETIIIADETCWDCDGEGSYLQEVSGGYYSSAQEQWYPDEEEVQCATCHGEGVLFEVERCGRCGELADDCECDEDDLEEWLLSIVALTSEAEGEFAKEVVEVDWNTAHYIAAAYKRDVRYEPGRAIVHYHGSTFVGVAS